MTEPKMTGDSRHGYIAWIQGVAESAICETKESAYRDLCRVLANMLDKKVS